MNIIEALREIRKSYNTITHSQGDTCDIDTLLDDLDFVEDILSEPCDKGEWIVEGDTITHLDADGYRDGPYYTAS